MDIVRVQTLKTRVFPQGGIKVADNDDKNKHDKTNDTPSENDSGFDPSRRRFVKNTGIAIGGVAGGSILGGLFTNQFLTTDDKEKEKGAGTSQAILQDARTFFSRSDDFETLAAATERIYPDDDHGPGAIELGVPYYIDKQLAGSFGSNAHDYMRGPFKIRESNLLEYQTKLNRGELFLVGLRRMLEISNEEHGEKFAGIEPEQQDAILESFEAGEAKMDGAPSEFFFHVLLQTTLEGIYADPVYGGNKDMMGWKMMEYPGPRMSWADKVEEEEFISLDPKSLREYQGGDV